MNEHDSPRLIADVGGSYARFVLETAPATFEEAASLRCADFADFHAAISHYLSQLPARPISHAAVAIANPVEGDRVRMTNYHWQFSIEEMRQRLQLETLVVVNDFTALAGAVPRLRVDQRRQIGGGTAREGSVAGVIGSGSGLGVSGLVPSGDGFVALGTEGGHASFAPRDERELDILRFAQRQYPHVSFERLLSGPGLELIHRALSERAGQPAPALPAPEITRRAQQGGDALCAEALDTFCAMLGTAAANLAVTLGALGGIYIGGGIVPRLGEAFDRSPFRARFEDKGRFSAYLQAIPTFVITAEQATLVGAAAILAEQLKRRQSHGGSTILAQVQRARDKLSPAEKRVADLVLTHPRTTLGNPIVDIARAAAVSQPTVIRFCRSLGCDGLSDFKLRLASSLSGTVPLNHTQVTGDDSTLELGAKVLSNTASAILQLRDALNRATIDRAIDFINAASRVDFFAVGHYGVVANDAQFKFLRFGVPCGSFVEPRLQLLAARVLKAGDVAVIISSSGRIEALAELAQAAQARGALVVAITASDSPLAKQADVALLIDHSEDLATHVPMISRILHLLVVDILAVGVAMRRGAGSDLNDRSAGAPTQDVTAVEGEAVRAGAVITAAGPLARLTSHSR